MPRKVYLAPHLSTEKLKKKYRTSEDPVESRRWHLLWKISLGWTIKNSAIAIGLKYEYCQKILKRYNEQGEEGVKNGRKRRKNHRRGKEALLMEEQLEKL
ncbi:MAG: helix-turn-helix domain-containing protein, partial [Spirulina sp.]